MWAKLKELIAWSSRLGQPLSSHARKRRRLSAVSVSIALHAAFILSLVISSGGALLTGGSLVGDVGDAEVVPVALAGAPGEASRKSTPEDDLQKLLTKLRSDDSSVVVEPPKPDVKPNTKLDKLFDPLDRAHANSSGDPGSGGRAKQDKGGKGSSANGAATADERSKADPSRAKPDVNPGKAASSGSLWGQIERCWRKLPDRSTVPVTLEIALSPEGLIATPPKIIRPNAEAPSEKRLISEARALEAVRSCVPYHGPDLAANGGVVRVNFASSK
jgi:hypothetical protein